MKKSVKKKPEKIAKTGIAKRNKITSPLMVGLGNRYSKISFVKKNVNIMPNSKEAIIILSLTLYSSSI
jgi:hypothetical protein